MASTKPSLTAKASVIRGRLTLRRTVGFVLSTYICDPMAGTFKYFLLFLVTLLYLQAAFEVNTDSIKNTWGDEYDTYVHSTDGKPTYHTERYNPDSFVISPQAISSQVFRIHAFSSRKIADQRTCNVLVAKLFLSYCSFLI